LKNDNPDLKILLAIGGWNHGVETFSALVDNAADMETFANNVIKFLRRINFDGLDLDWEYPYIYQNINRHVYAIESLSRTNVGHVKCIPWFFKLKRLNNRKRKRGINDLLHEVMQYHI
jgi:GH18 family chitinase